MKKLTIINGLMLGVVLYLLIDKYKKKKKCSCEELIPDSVIDVIDEPAPTDTSSLEVIKEVIPDPILESASVPAIPINNNTFNSINGFNRDVFSIAIQLDGKILVGGSFSAYQGISANNIIRLEQNGDIDKTFSYGNGFDGEIKSIAIQPDGKILIGGSFKNYQDVSAKRIVRLNPNGTIDDTFIYGDAFDNIVHCIKPQPDGKILVGGYFKYYKNRTANRIIRLDKNGNIDTTFVYAGGFDASVDTIALQNDGKILTGGKFKNYQGLSARGIIRLNMDASIDNTFMYGTGFNDAVYVIELQIDGKIFVGGNFINYNGVITNRMAILNPNGFMDETFIYGTGFNNTVNAMKILQSKTTIIGGAFTNYNGSVHNRIASIDNGGVN